MNNDKQFNHDRIRGYLGTNFPNAKVSVVDTVAESAIKAGWKNIEHVISHLKDKKEYTATPRLFTLQGDDNKIALQMLEGIQTEFMPD